MKKEFLEGLFGERVNFDPVERMLYGHDVAEVPFLVKFLLGDMIPRAVVQPSGEGELVELVKWANQNGVPLTPRGKGTSGYGGAIPLKGSIVIDFWRMKEVLEVDEKGLIVKVQPGITWEQLDRKLMERGLTLRLYPTSYPSATVGGWLSQGGAGIGSFEYGYFKENVVSAKVVLPDGSLKTFEGEELDLISDAEGITGIITEISLRVRPLDEIEVLGIALPDAEKMQSFLEEIIKKNLPIWSITFINPRMAELKNRTSSLVHQKTGNHHIFLPAAYILILSLRKEDSPKVREILKSSLPKYAGGFLPDHISWHEWEQRFRLMLVKRLGPSLVPAEVVVPLEVLGKTLNELEEKVRQPLVKEGVIIKEGIKGKAEAVILGFIPADERKALSYQLEFLLAFTVLKTALKYGGRPYSTGIYFSAWAEKVLGKERLEKIKIFKKEIDPRGILNPGKVIGNKLSPVIFLGKALEPLFRPLANSLTTRLKERPQGKVKGLPGDVIWYAYSCSQCGYCVEECDQFYSRGWESQSPRGKWYWLRLYEKGKTKWTQKMVDTFLVCTTCELCNVRCSAYLPIEGSWMKLRGHLIQEEKRMTFPPFEMMASSLLKEGNIWAHLRSERANWFPKDLWEKHGPHVIADFVYFAGCTASYVEKDIAIASVRILDEAGLEFSYLGERENCCGTPMLVAGKWDIFQTIMLRNIEAVKEKGAKTVITSCPACDMMWRHYYPIWAQKLNIPYDIRVKHYSEIISEKIQKGEFKIPSGEKGKTVTFHDSCHIGRVSGIYEEPRTLIKAVQGVELRELPFNRENAHCCGSVLTLIKEPEIAAVIGELRLKEALKTETSEIIALCPCCEFQFRITAKKRGIPIKVTDLARFMAERFGYKLPDPESEVVAVWEVFEKMIALMTPEGFANLMGSLWDEILEAMPLGMGAMMKKLSKLPGALTLLKPLFPVLFPKLLPIVMPKVMERMLEKIRERIPMPEYMAQQIPILMPQVMDALMPHMIKDLLPLAVPSLIKHLKGKG